MVWPAILSLTIRGDGQEPRAVTLGESQVLLGFGIFICKLGMGNALEQGFSARAVHQNHPLGLLRCTCPSPGAYD